MRGFFVALLAVGGLAGLGACATSGASYPTYSEELAELRADCTARGGILTPIVGSIGPDPANDYACTTGGSGFIRRN